MCRCFVVEGLVGLAYPRLGLVEQFRRTAQWEIYQLSASTTVKTGKTRNVPHDDKYKVTNKQVECGGRGCERKKKMKQQSRLTSILGR